MSCNIIISRGKNRGRRCGDTNTRCYHVNIRCKNCGKTFMMKHSFDDHKKVCKKILVSKKKDVEDIVNKVVSEKVNAAVKEVDNKVSAVEEEIKEIRNRPQVLNFYIGDNIYDDLVKKMGKEDAVDMLIRAASDNNPLSIIDKLYLDGPNKEDWPIAYKDGEFKYLDKDKRMVVDKTGKKMTELVGKVHNAMIKAVSEMITKNLEGSAKDVEGMYDTYNMMKIQRNLYKFCGKTELYCNKLQTKIRNPVHPFFQRYFIKLFFDDNMNINLDEKS
jgi:hypothetical protein